MDFWDVVEKRHSVREYRSDPVPRDVLERILLAAAAAPSAFNSQPWRFYVTQGKTRAMLGTLISQATVHLTEYMEVLGPERYQHAMGWYSALGEVPVVIGVSMPMATSELDGMNKLLSVGAAMENLMLAATAEGLGTCPITFAWWVKEELADLLEIGPERQVVALIAVGYAAETAPTSPNHDADSVVWFD